MQDTTDFPFMVSKYMANHTWLSNIDNASFANVNEKTHNFHTRKCIWSSPSGPSVSASMCQHHIHVIHHTFNSPWCRTYVSVNWISIGSDNGLAPNRRQAIIWTNAGLLSIGPFGTNFSEILIKIQNFSFTKIRLKISSAKWLLYRVPGEMR